MSDAEFQIDKPTRDGQQLIERWQNAQRDLERARSAENRADCEYQNAKTALGRWLTPKDGKVGEKFSIWYGAELIEVDVLELSGNGSYAITKRARK